MRRAVPILLLGALLSGCVKDTPGYCSKHDDCAPTEFCSLPAQRCLTGERPKPKVVCQQNSDCQENQICLAPECVNAIARGFFSGAQVVPPTASIAQGTILLYLKPSNMELVYSMVHEVEAPVTARIHQGRPGENGPNVLELKTGANTLDTIPIASDQITELAAGNYYVSIASPSLPGGEVRAQIYSLMPGQEQGPTEFVAILTAQQTKPQIRSMARGRADVTIIPASNQIRYLTTHNLDNPITGFHIHRGAFNTEGPHIADLPPDSTPTLSGSLGPAEIARYKEGAIWPLLFKSGLAYFNLHTMRFSSGELRGQLLPFRKMPFAVAIPFNVPLEGAQVVPAVNTVATGQAQFFLSEDQTRLAWRLVHNAVSPLRAEIRKGMRGQNGAVVCELKDLASNSSGATKSQGFCDVKASGGAADLLRSDLLSGALYVLVQTSANMNGELRGQLTLPQLP